jgi:DNA-binding NarL/FixJ family response regulator
VRSDGGLSALIVARPGSWRDALQATLVEIPRIETIQLAGDAASAYLSIAMHCPDLVLLDADLPGGCAWTFSHELGTVCPDARSLVLADGLSDAESSGVISVDAVVVKGSPATALFEALESLLPGADTGEVRERSAA